MELELNGSVVASGQAPAGGPAHSDVSMSFAMPNWPPGRYPLVAVGPPFALECGAADGAAGVEVLAFDRQRHVGRRGQQPQHPQRIGIIRWFDLARTGIGIALLLLIAIVLLVVGRAVLKRSDGARSGRRGAERRRRARDRERELADR